MRRSLLRAAAFAAKRASAPSSALCTRAAPARQFGLVAGGCGLGNAVAARSLLPAAARLLHTSPTALAGGRPSLEETLKEELAHEQGDYDTPELVKQGPPPPFKLAETPGGRVLTLSRAFGKETVTVTVSVEDETGEEEWTEDATGDAAEEEEGDNPSPPSLFFEVRVTKAERVLAFECVTDGCEVDILRVDLLREGEEHDELYTGPEYSSLDETLQSAFADYLESRGVDGALAEYLVELASDKEQREYTNWLRGTAAFVGR